MVRYTLKILSDHFGRLCIKGLKQQLAQTLDNANIKYIIYLKFTYTKKTFFGEILGIIQRVFSVTINCQRLPKRKNLRHIRSLEEVKKW